MKPNITLEQLFHKERPRLIRWMTKLTESPHIAEDLVQETYLIAWQNRQKIDDPSGADKWLNTIAYNIYKRWLRSNGKQAKHETALEQASTDALAEYQLEQSELSDLLDNALALLSPENRAILLARYLEEQPQAKVARDLGMTESAVAVRLHRGKMTLRKIIDAELADTDDGWQSTRLWCGVCGRNHYQAKFDSESGELILHCPQCDFGEDYPAWSSDGADNVLKGIKTIKPAFNRLRAVHFQACSQALTQQQHYLCEACASVASIKLTMPDYIPYSAAHPGIHIVCPRCGVITYSALNGIAGSSPEAFAFEKDNPRFETLAPEHLTYQGLDALKIRFQSLRQHDSLDTIFAQDSYRLLAIYRNGKDVSDES